MVDLSNFCLIKQMASENTTNTLDEGKKALITELIIDEHKAEEIIVEPGDSVSQIGLSCFAIGKAPPSSISHVPDISVASAKLKEELKRAELSASVAALNQTEALELERLELETKQRALNIKLEAKQRALKIKTKLAAAEARARVYSNLQSEIAQIPQAQSTPSEAPKKYLNPQAQEYTPTTPRQIVEGIGSRDYNKEQQIPVMQTPQTLGTVYSPQTMLSPPTVSVHQPMRAASNYEPHLKGPLNETSPINNRDTQYSLTNEDNFNDLVRRQNEITEMLVKQHIKFALPKSEVPVFGGNPLEYQRFVRAFEHVIADKTDSFKDKIYYLEQYTRGEAQAIVRSCMYMDSRNGYETARKLLEREFGNEYKVATAQIDKALNWPMIRSEDAAALASYALFLTECSNAMSDVKLMEQLDHPKNLQIIVSRLPYKLRERWRTQAYDIRDKQQRTANFRDLTRYVNKQAKIITDPVFGSISDGERSEKVMRNPINKGNNKRGNSVTNVNASKVSDVADEKPASPSKHAAGKGPCNAFAKPCAYCSGEHTMKECRRLKGKKNTDKIEFLRSKGLCFGCLKSGHTSRECTQRLQCADCSLSHPTVLHLKRKEDKEKRETPNNEASSQTDTDDGNERSTSCASTSTGAGDQDNSLSIVPVKVKLKNSDKFIETYAFLDNGSCATFCTESLARRLNANGRRKRILLHTMNQDKYVDTLVISNMEISSLDAADLVELPEVFTQPSMPASQGNIPTQADVDKWPHLSKLRVPNVDAEVELLIGANVPKAMEPWEIINSKDDGPYAVRTVLGWAINGPLRCIDSDHVHSYRTSVTTLEQQLINQFNYDFSERTIDDEPERSREDHQFMEHANATLAQEDGHYSIGLPLRSKEVSMPNNRAVAEQRTRHLKRKFDKDAKFYEEYRAFMSNVIDNGYAEQVPEDELTKDDGRVWYIPHHGVYHPRKGKIRVVFDCAASYQGTSLNGCLLQGPNLTNSLIGVLTRFREERIAMLADIESMFYQVKVPSEDCDLLRFMWWPGGDLTRGLKEYRMVVHLFGSVSSPSCANLALRQTAEDCRDEFGSDVSDTIVRNFYVDDLLKSVPTEEQATSLASDLQAACAKGGFNLTKWICNNRAVLSSIPEERRAKEVKDLDLDQDSLPIERALGMQWSVESDQFEFEIAVQERPATRRGILSTTSSVYDPLGLLAPFILPARIIQQDLCRLKIGWDDPIPDKHLEQWQAWISDLEKIEDFKVDRCFKPNGFGEVVSAELHHFADASESGYGTASYIRMRDETGKVHVALVMGKSRVAPLKQVTIPRLELTAATVLVRIDKMMRKEIDIPIDRSVFWTDSTSVLKYIQNETTRFHTFVANRVSVIREGSKPAQWRYVESASNPADEASRGLSAEGFLGNQRWTHGPEFLRNEEEVWPQLNDRLKLTAEDPEVKEIAVVNAISADDVNTVDRLITHFSSWTKLKRCTAWILKVRAALLDRSKAKLEYVNACKVGKAVASSGKSNEPSDVQGKPYLTVEDLRNAERQIISFVQRQSFREEVDTLIKKEAYVKKSSSIHKLAPVLDESLLRVGGRLSRGAMPEECKHPIIVPKGTHVSKLILRQIHQDVNHEGRNHMLSRLREKFWIVNANSTARRIIKECVKCQKQRAKVGEQMMADLPPERIIPDEPPFTRVGVDYFGPIEIKRGRSMVKRYGVLFTCLAIRAVHIEVAHTLDTDSCINALRRFVSRRGQVREMISDNGTNLKATERELKGSISEFNESSIREAMVQRNIDWKFNPPTGSHHGGVWERQIRTVRKILTAILKEQTLDDEGLHTLLCEVEATINDRPITPVSSDPNDLQALTPNCLLLLKTKPSLPPGVFDRKDMYVRRKWRQVQYMADLFWKRWSREYLTQLQERRKWVKPRRNLSEGDIVLLVDDTAPRNSWLMGRVTETMPDRNGFVRRVKVKTKTSTLERPITKLCLLIESEGDN